MKKIAFALLGLLLLVPLCVPSAYAEEEIPGDFPGLSDVLPEQAREMLPEGLFSDDPSAVAEAVGEVLAPDALLSLILRLIGGGLGSALGLFASLTALLLLSSFGGAVSGGLLSESPEISSAVSLALRAAVAVSSAGMMADRLRAADGFFAVLRGVMTALLPVMELIYLSGGNGAAAALNNSTVILWLDLIDLLVSVLLIPALSAVTALALAESFLGEEISGFSAVGGVIKQAVGFVLGLGATLLAASLGTQTIIACAGDGISAKTVKYMAGNLIPVVGSTVGDAMRTVAASAKVLRGTVGGAGIAVIAVVVLPVLVNLLLSRLALDASAAVGEMLGCRAEAKFLREMESVTGFLIAAAVLCSLLFMFALTVFALTTSAAA